jgi:stage IV sporulation protein FB
MENFEENPDTVADSTEHAIVYPPKYEKQEQQGNIWIKSVASLALYLVAGYFFFPNYKILFLITAVVMIHELGHFIAMKYFGYSELGIFFIPLLGAYVSGNKREVSQAQSAVILLAGPLPGIVIGIIFLLLNQNGADLHLFGISYIQIGLLFMLLNLINLVPVYPLDGGQLLNRVFLDEESVWSKAFVFLSAALMCWIVWRWYSFSHNPVVFILLLFPLNLLIRRLTEPKLSGIEKRIEAEGINTDIDYEDLPDEDYWKIRNILIQEHPLFKDVPAAPPFDYCDKEEKIMTTIESLLHRHLIQDVSVAGKLLILIIWIAAIASPWLVNMNMQFFNKFGF